MHAGCCTLSTMKQYSIKIIQLWCNFCFLPSFQCFALGWAHLKHKIGRFCLKAQYIPLRFFKHMRILQTPDRAMHCQV